MRDDELVAPPAQVAQEVREGPPDEHIPPAYRGAALLSRKEFWRVRAQFLLGVIENAADDLDEWDETIAHLAMGDCDYSILQADSIRAIQEMGRDE